MTGPAIGQSAPPFRLPSAQGAEVGLEDYRGRNNVILWFTTGMACGFCRQQMSQFARLGPELKTRHAEVLQVTPTRPDRARFYGQNFRLPFLYLCDPEYRVHCAYGLDVRPRSIAGYAKAFYHGSRATPPPSDFGSVKVALRDVPALLRDNDMGVFVVDRGGVVRYVYAGSYELSEGEAARAGGPTRPLPDRQTLFGALERCQ